MGVGEAFCVGYAVRVVCCTEDRNMSLLGCCWQKKIITCNDEDK